MRQREATGREVSVTSGQEGWEQGLLTDPHWQPCILFCFYLASKFPHFRNNPAMKINLIWSFKCCPQNSLKLDFFSSARVEDNLHLSYIFRLKSQLWTLNSRHDSQVKGDFLFSEIKAQLEKLFCTDKLLLGLKDILKMMWDLTNKSTPLEIVFSYFIFMFYFHINVQPQRVI